VRLFRWTATESDPRRIWHGPSSCVPDLMSASRDSWRVRLYRRFFAAIPIITAPLGLAIWMVGGGDRDWIPLAVQWLLVGLAFASGLCLVSLFIWKWSQPLWLALNLYDPTRWWGLLMPVWNTLYAAGMATSGFAVLSTFLYARGVATPSLGRALSDPYNDTFWYYVWSFLDAIPLLDLPLTFGWKRPFRFTDPVSRVLLLL
jgi:hypothetical protein